MVWDSYDWKNESCLLFEIMFFRWDEFIFWRFEPVVNGIDGFDIRSIVWRWDGIKEMMDVILFGEENLVTVKRGRMLWV